MKIRSLLFIMILFLTTLVCFSVTPDLTGSVEYQSDQSVVSNTRSDLIPNFEVKLDTYSFGHQEDFWTANLQTSDWYEVRATLLAVGEHCYLYMDNRTINSIGQSTAIDLCRIYSSEFDQTIYPKNLELMGHPNGTLGDVDGDLRITVFLVEGVGSYYLQYNELPYTTNSNNREMVYVNSNMGLYHTIETICHETNHLFLFNYDLDESRYFIEGLAEFSTYYVGYRNNYSFVQWSELNLNNTNALYYFSQYPDVSMLYFDRNYHASANYGAGYLFLLYISERYGIDIIYDLVPIDVLDGAYALEYVLSEHGFNISFNEVFMNFITASTIDQLGIYDDLYGFVNTDFQIDNRDYVQRLPSTYDDKLYRYYGVSIQEIDEPPNEFTVQIETPIAPSVIGLSVVILDKNGYNISQSILNGTGITNYLHFTGDDIETAFIITSMLKEGTPDPVRDWMPSPTALLDLKIQSGLITHNTNGTNFLFLSIILPVVFILYFKKKANKIKTN